MKYTDIRRAHLSILCPVGNSIDSDKFDAAVNVHGAAFRVMARHGSKVSRWSERKFRNHVAAEAVGLPIILTWFLPTLISWALSSLLPLIMSWLSQRATVPRGAADESIEQELKRLGMESKA